ncbi:hypothetical protein EC991_001551 [Linnemannia zychae]|nr:hypothetical protein EC991_001551 [Linnemannia zychae]
MHSTPPWKQVASTGVVPGPVIAGSGYSASLSKDRKTITFWSTSSSLKRAIINFDITSGTWEALSAPVTMANSYYALPATTDPITGVVYVPNGLADDTMLVFNPETRTVTSAPMPPLNLKDWFPAVWSTVRGSLLVLGGDGPVLSYFYEFKPPIGPWTEVAINGSRQAQH